MTRSKEKYAAKKELGAATVRNAVMNSSTRNYAEIFEGFAAMGIDPDQVVPRHNVFTYNGWIALGRQVQKGSKGVKGVTWIELKDKSGNVTGRRPKSYTVFHVSQTQPIESEVPA